MVLTTDEQRFTAQIEGGAGADLLTVAGRLTSSTDAMPLLTSSLLNLPDGATYATGAAYVLARAAAGLVPLP